MDAKMTLRAQRPLPTPGHRPRQHQASLSLENPPRPEMHSRQGKLRLMAAVAPSLTTLCVVTGRKARAAQCTAIVVALPLTVRKDASLGHALAALSSKLLRLVPPLLRLNLVLLP